MAEKEVTSIWQDEEFEPYQNGFIKRQAMLRNNEKYYTGLGKDVPMASLPAISHLNQQIKVLFQPLAGAVHIDVSLIPSGWQLDDESQQHTDAMRRVFKASKWNLESQMYCHNGATMGQGTLKVWWDENGAYIQPIRPDSVLMIHKSTYAQKASMAIVVGENGKGQEVAEVWEPDRVRTFVSGQPADISGNGAEFENILGELPIVDQQFIYTGARMGETTYMAAQEPLKGVNRQAVGLSQLIDDHVEPQWVAYVENPERNAEELIKSGDNVWWMPNGSGIDALVAKLDIPGVLSFIKEVKDEVKETLPELLVFRLIGMNRISLPGLEVQLLPLTVKIHRVRRSLDCGVADALKLVGRLYANERTQFKDADLARLDDPMLGFNAERPVVFMDALSAISIEQSKLALESQRLAVSDQQDLANGDGM